MSQSNLKAFISFGLLFFISPVIWAGSYSIEGELEVIYVDYFTPDTSELIYQIKDKNGLATQLTIPDSINKDNLETGLNVKVSGVEAVGLNRSLNSSALINSMEVEALDILPSVEKMTMEVSGVRKAVVLMVDFNDKKSSDVTSIEKINGMMYTNAKSTNQIYKESSFDKIRFEPDSDGDGKSDIFHVELNYDAGDSCDYNKWANDAEQAAENMGVDLGLYQHKVTVLSNQVSCGWGGLGHLGCGSSCRAWVKWHSTIVYAHELGHNLRMHHASTDPENDGTINSEYGDHSGIMGNNTSVRQVNGPHRIQMDWYSDLPDQIHAVTYDTTLQLYPLENNPVNGTQGLQIIEIPKLEGSEKYYLTYRKNTGTFGMASTYRDKVNVHRFSGGGN